MNKKNIVLLVIAVIVVGGVAVYSNRQNIVKQFMKPTESKLANSDFSVENLTDAEQIVAENLKVPWEIAFLPDNTILVTERPGTLKHIKDRTTVVNVEGVKQTSEGGLLGMALHPNFKNNQYIYLYSTTSVDGNLFNRVERYKYANDRLTDRTTILNNIPASNNHDGGRIAFGPDGFLYITTGDAQNEDNAQDKAVLAGKILRIKDDGIIPADNPFGNAVYSFGHRNPQGLAWDSTGQLWATEHGPSGLDAGQDELNRIEKGKNYGWPIITGDKTQEGMTAPVIHSGEDETWAPAGLAYYKGQLIFAGLRGQAIYATLVSGSPAQIGNLTAYVKQKYGRLRSVVAGPDGFLYFSTSNTDGRGTVNNGDDKIIKVKPKF